MQPQLKNQKSDEKRYVFPVSQRETTRLIETMQSESGCAVKCMWTVHTVHMLGSLLNHDSELEQGMCPELCSSCSVHVRSCNMHARTRDCVHGWVCVGSSSEKVRGY